jgi:hypothetical protein
VRSKFSLVGLALATVITSFCVSAATAHAAAPKPRVVLTADPEKDDNNSLIRYLAFSDWFDTEAIVLTSSQFHWSGDGKGTKWYVAGREYTRAAFPNPNLCPCTSYRWPADPKSFMEHELDAYEQIYPNLKIHSAGYPTPAELKSKYRVGNIEFDGDMSKDTPGSDLIKQVLLDDKPGPVYLLAWGGMASIARALRSIQLQYEGTPEWPAIYDKVSRKALLQTSGDQDNLLANYIRPNWPLIRTGGGGGNGGGGGGLGYGAQSSASAANRPYYSAEWMKANILDSGPLGALEYTWGDGREMAPGDITDFFWQSGLTREQLVAQGYYVWTNLQAKGEFVGEGDTPTFLNLLGNGMRSFERPGWGSYSGGRYFAFGENELATRLKWGKTPNYADANHPPVVSVDGPLDITAAPGDIVKLKGSATDPDGNTLTYNWYEDTGSDTYPGTITLTSTNTPSTSFEVPANSVVPPAATPGQTIHMILEVSDSGSPSLARYQRVVITVAARAAGIVNGTVTPTLGLTLGTAPALGPFVAGTAANYTSTSTATVTVTAGDAILTAGDASPTAPGRLVNGTAALATPLMLRASSAGGIGGPLVALPASTNPTTLLTYNGPVTRDAVTLTYQQAISATEVLRSGTYTKAVTYTLATTNP